MESNNVRHSLACHLGSEDPPRRIGFLLDFRLCIPAQQRRPDRPPRHQQPGRRIPPAPAQPLPRAPAGTRARRADLGAPPDPLVFTRGRTCQGTGTRYRACWVGANWRSWRLAVGQAHRGGEVGLARRPRHNQDAHARQMLPRRAEHRFHVTHDVLVRPVPPLVIRAYLDDVRLPVGELVELRNDLIRGWPGRAQIVHVAVRPIRPVTTGDKPIAGKQHRTRRLIFPRSRTTLPRTHAIGRLRRISTR